MHKKLRQRVLTKLAQTQPTQPETTTPSIPAPAPPPTDLFSYLNEGYNGATVAILKALTSRLNTALHYASNGKDNFQDIVNNNMDLSGATPDHRNVGGICQRVYNTFLNRKNSFNSKKVNPATITTWADAITSSSEYNNLSQVNPTGQLAIKLQGNLKSEILNFMNGIKQVNPTV